MQLLLTLILVLRVLDYVTLATIVEVPSFVSLMPMSYCQKALALKPLVYYVHILLHVARKDKLSSYRAILDLCCFFQLCNRVARSR